jgi:hypothetical protein
MCKHGRFINQLFLLLFIIGVPSHIVAHKVVAEVSSDLPYVKGVLMASLSSINLSLYLRLELLIPRIIILIDKVISNVVIIKVNAFFISMIVSLAKDLLRPRHCEATRFTMMELG